MKDNLEYKMKLDIGGTPSNVLGKTKKSIAYAMKYTDGGMAVILDPFNLARLERILPLGENFKTRQLKFSVPVPGGNTDLSSEAVPSPDPEKISSGLLGAKSKILGKIGNDYGWRLTDKAELERRYDQLVREIPELAGSSKNLRVFMNSLVGKFLDPVQVVLSEDIFSRNPEKTYALMERFKVPVRAVCPKCDTFKNLTLGENLSCCGVSSDEIIKSGKFIP